MAQWANLRVEEAREPVRFGAASAEPAQQLVMPLQQPCKPAAQRACLPALCQPVLGDAPIVQGIQGVCQLPAQRYGACSADARLIAWAVALMVHLACCQENTHSTKHCSLSPLAGYSVSRPATLGWFQECEVVGEQLSWQIVSI